MCLHKPSLIHKALAQGGKHPADLALLTSVAAFGLRYGSHKLGIAHPRKLSLIALRLSAVRPSPCLLPSSDGLQHGFAMLPKLPQHLIVVKSLQFLC